MKNKKILSMILAGTMLNGLVPYNVFANEEVADAENIKAIEKMANSVEFRASETEFKDEYKEKEEVTDDRDKEKEEVREEKRVEKEVVKESIQEEKRNKRSKENIRLMPLKVLNGKPIKINDIKINRNEMDSSNDTFYLNMEIGDIITLESDQESNNFIIEEYEILSDCEIVENSINGKNVRIKITGNNPGIKLINKKMKQIYVGNGTLEGEFESNKDGVFKIKADNDSDNKIFLYWDFIYDIDRNYHIINGNILSRELTIKNIDGSNTFEAEAVFGDKNKKFNLRTDETLVNKEEPNREQEYQYGYEMTLKANPRDQRKKFKEWNIEVYGNRSIVPTIYEEKIKDEIEKGIDDDEITFTMPYANVEIYPIFEDNDDYYDENIIKSEEIKLNINLLNKELNDKNYTVFVYKDDNDKAMNSEEDGSYLLSLDDSKDGYRIEILKDGYCTSMFRIDVSNRENAKYFILNGGRDNITYDIKDNNVTAKVKLNRLRDVKIKKPGMPTKINKLGEKERIDLTRISDKDDFLRWEVIGIEGLSNSQLTNKEHESRISFEIPEADIENDNGIYIKEVTKNSNREYDLKVKNGKILSLNGEKIDSSKIKTEKNGKNEYKVIKAKDGDFIELEVENKDDFSSWEESRNCSIVEDRENEKSREHEKEKILVEMLDGDVSIEALNNNGRPNYQRININSVKVYNDCILIDSDEANADILVRNYNGERLFTGKTDKNGNAKINIKNFAKNGGNIRLEKEVDFGYKNAYVNIEKQIVEIIDRNYEEKDSSSDTSNNNSSKDDSSKDNSSKDDDYESKYEKGDKISVRDLKIDDKSNKRTRIRGNINRHNNSYVSIYNDGYYIDYVKTDDDGDFDITIDEKVDSKSDLKFYAGKVRNKLDGEKEKKEDDDKKEEKSDLNKTAEDIINKHSNDLLNKNTTNTKINEKAYVKGYSDNTFKPNNQVTRAEAVSMFARLINVSDNFKVNSNNKFNDISNEWYSDAVDFITEKGFMGGYEDGSFKPNNQMTRAEFATMISKYINAGSNKVNFTDTSSHWANSAIEKVASAGIIKGYEDGSFKPNNSITRAEAITILNRVFNLNSGTGNVSFSDVNTNDWYYNEIAKAVK